MVSEISLFTITAWVGSSKTNHSLDFGGTRGVVIIAVGNEHGNTISNPGRD